MASAIVSCSRAAVGKASRASQARDSAVISQLRDGTPWW
jgi:hypothetical protein